MDSLKELLAFVHAAQTLSFVAAGERIGISASAVGKSVARLESRLGLRLLNRSTRRISLTAEGELLLERCQRIIAELEQTESELAGIREQPRGRLRVSLPVACYRMLLPILPGFLQRYPDVEFDLDFNDRLIDVIAEGMDVVIRSGEITTSQLMSRRLGPFRFVLVSSPDYFRRNRQPWQVADLEQHACLRYRFATTGLLQEWPLHLSPGATPPRLKTALICNNIEALVLAATHGLGIACIPEFVVREALASGALVSVLSESLPEEGRFSVLWPGNRHLSRRVRVFVDYLAEQLTP